MTTPRPGPPRRARLVVVLGLLEGFGPLCMDLYLPQLPDLADSLGTSDALAQSSMSVCMLGLGLGQLVAGPVSDRYGRKGPLVVGVAAFAALSLACALATSIEALLVLRLLQGLAGSAGVVISLAVARDLFRGVELSRMLSLLALVTSSTPVIAPVLGGQLARWMDWRGIFLVLAGLGLVLLGLAVLGLEETLPRGRRRGAPRFPPDAVPPGPGARRGREPSPLRDPLLLALLAATALGGVAFFSYLAMSSFVLRDGFGFSAQLFSLCFAVNALANLCGAQLSRALVGRWGTRGLYLAAQGAAAPVALGLVAAAALGAPAPAYLAILACYLGVSGLSMPNGTALALERHGERAGTAAALLGVSTFAVGAVAVPLYSAAAGTTALTLAAAIAVGSCGAAAVALTAVRRLA